MTDRPEITPGDLTIAMTLMMFLGMGIGVFMGYMIW